jgi:ATP-dependent exoDNAse (exonuclease V) beta subunit
LGALALIFSEPKNHFEIVGVLREIFGISDQQLADFAKGRGEVFRIDIPSTRKGEVADVLQKLYEIRENLQGLPLLDQVRMIVRQVRLHERLRDLPQRGFVPLEQELDRWILSAAKAEVDGFSLQQWAQTLQNEAESLVLSQPVQSDSLQLITCQKAKGLQWKAVIIPYFHRRIRRSAHAFSDQALAHHEDRYEAFAGNLDSDPKKNLLRRYDQEMQRILYVALTRAEKTLVLIDDSALFQNQSRSQTKSFAELLSPSLEDHIFNAISWDPELIPEASIGDQALRSSVDLAAELPKFTKEDFQIARLRAKDFPCRILPHTLVVREKGSHLSQVFPGTDEEKGFMGKGAAVDYGIWWHQLMDSIPWNQGVEGWEKMFKVHLELSPDRDRSQQEWTLFCSSEKIFHLQRSRAGIRTEVSIFWVKTSKEVIEGVIDLLWVEPGSDQCLILDWKTDRVDVANVSKLIDQYAPQVQSYLFAVSELTGLKCQAKLYSTSTGLWLTVPTESSGAC